MSWSLINNAKKTLIQERGTIKKARGGRIRVAIAYPNLYYIGMSNLGFHTIYYLLNSLPDVLCERVFLPNKDECQAYTSTNTALFTLESQKPLYEFDIIAFSVSFENDYINILKILDMAKIPLKRGERNNSHPLIIAGGVASSMNPEPVSDFIDLFVIGEGEEVIPELFVSYKKGMENGYKKDEILGNVADIVGVYVPGYYTVDYKSDGTVRDFEPKGRVSRKVKRRWVKDVDKFKTHSIVLTPNTEFSNMFLIEISRGCKWGCRFCAAGFIYRPYRKRGLENLRETVTKGLKDKDKIGLVGAAVSDYPMLPELCELILARGGKVSLASLRADSLDDRVVKCLKASGHKTISLAPEVGSERLCGVIGKKITEEDILGGAEMIISNDILNLKLYFLIGLPAETLEDIEEIVHLVKKVKHRILEASKGKKRLGRVTLSINSFVPKPATPFQWHPFDDIKFLNNKLKVIRNALKKESNINVISDLPKWGYVQSLLSRGDRRVGRIILAAYRFGGDWKKAFRETDINPDFYVYRQRYFEEIFPWDFIDHGMKKEHLFAEYQKAMA
ncbi:MAG: TIGR03960 family B12-binding radical SAM protein [Desulfobacterales bacterium]|nr:TIGR03960 family B12-binding radical SAM protein [Desulfobacterales bacterium]